MRLKILALCLFTGSLFSGCNGCTPQDEAKENDQGLAMPSTLSVIAAKDDSAGSTSAARGLRLNYGFIAQAFNDPETDYSKDRTFVYVFDPAIQPFDEINSILCAMEQTRADQMVNQGPYIALVDTSLCDDGGSKIGGGAGGSSGAGGGGTSQSSSSGHSASYEKWTVVSKRVGDEPQKVKLWIHNTGEMDMEQTILAEVIISEAANDENPYGRFKLNFTSKMPEGMPGMSGTLKTVKAENGQIALSLYMGVSDTDSSMGFAFSNAASIIMNKDGTAGAGQTRMTMSGMGGDAVQGGTLDTWEQSFKLVYDETHFLRAQDADPASCYSRDSFNLNAWRYDLYHAADGSFNGRQVTAGERVKINSGFPFTYTLENMEHYGYASYWGVWAEGDSDLTGVTITKQSFWPEEKDAEPEQYTLQSAPGKLIKRTAGKILLTKLAKEKFSYWGDPESTGTWAEYYIKYNVTGTQFEAVARVDGWGEYGPNVTPINPVALALNTGETLWLWSESLGGGLVYTHPNDFATLYAEEFVVPTDPLFNNSDAAVTLNCWERCLPAPITGTSWNGVYMNDQTNKTPSYQFTISRTDMTLKYAGAAVVFGTGVDLSASEFQWGIQSGEMVTGAVMANMTNPWDVYDPVKVDVSYRWETGPNNWNRLIMVKNQATGTVVKFEKPIQFSYEHTTAADANGRDTHNGRTVMLNYGGHGDFWGIPWEFGAADEFGGGQPAFTIKAGTLAGPTGSEFVVKPIEIEQRMTPVDNSACSAINFGDADKIILPTEVDKQVDIGEEPVVDAAPAVIGGELQGT